MTRAQARRKKRRKAKMQRALGWTLIFAFEFIVSAAPAAITAAFLIPMANASRHYPGIGGRVDCDYACILLGIQGSA